MKKTVSLAIALNMILSMIAVPNVMVSAATASVIDDSNQAVDMVDTADDPWKVVVDDASGDSSKWVYDTLTVTSGGDNDPGGWGPYTDCNNKITVEKSGKGYYGSISTKYNGADITNPIYLGANPRGRTGMISYSIRVDHKGKHLQYVGGEYKNFGITFDLQFPNMCSTETAVPYLDIGLINSTAAKNTRLTQYADSEYVSMGDTVNMMTTVIPSKFNSDGIAPISAVIDDRTAEQFAADMAKRSYISESEQTDVDTTTKKTYIYSYQKADKSTAYLNQVINCKVVADGGVMSLYMKFEDTDTWKLINSYNISALQGKEKRFYIASKSCQLLVSNLNIYQRRSEIETEIVEPEDPGTPETTTVNVLSKNFESDTDDGVVNDSTYGIGKALEVTGNKRFYFTSPSYINANREFRTMTEFDIKTVGTDSTNYPTITWAGKDGKAVNTLTFEDNYVTLTYVNDSGYTKERAFIKLKDGEWNRIRLVTEFAKEGNTYVGRNKKLYINGNNVQAVIAEDLGSKVGADFLNAEYMNRINVNAGGATVYIDNINVTRFYNDAEEGINYGQLLASIRKGEKALSGAVVGTNIRQDIYNDYKTALDTAKTAYIASETTQDAIDAANDALCQAYSKLIFADEAYEICGVNFTDKDDKYTPYLTAGGKIASVTVRKNAEYNKLGVLILALYDKNGNLIKVKPVQKVFDGVNAGETKNVTIDMQLPADINGVYTKVMLLDTIDNITPLTNAHVPDNTTARTIRIAGDSIVHTYEGTTDEKKYPMQGWGAYAADYFNNSITAQNEATSGSTTRTFIGFSIFNRLASKMQAGDILLVSFMENDCRENDTYRHVSNYDYKNMLRLYADIAKENGAEIIFVTSPANLNETAGSDDFNGYKDLMKEVAKEYNAPCIDIWQESVDLQNKEGYEYVEAAMHMHNLDVLKANFNKNGKVINESTVNGKDIIHISEWGAQKVASWIAEEMKNTNSALRYYVNGKTFDFPEDMVTSTTLNQTTTE